MLTYKNFIKMIVAVSWLIFHIYLSFFVFKPIIVETNFSINSFIIKYMFVDDGVNQYKILYLIDAVFLLIATIVLFVVVYLNAFVCILGFVLLLLLPIGFILKFYFKIIFNKKYRSTKYYATFSEGLIHSVIFGTLTLKNKENPKFKYILTSSCSNEFVTPENIKNVLFMNKIKEEDLVNVMTGGSVRFCRMMNWCDSFRKIYITKD